MNESFKENAKMNFEKIEKELEEFLGSDTEELRKKIIDEAVWLRKDHSKMVVLRIFPDVYTLGFGQKGSYDGYSDEERLWASFSLIEPWDLPDYESVNKQDKDDIWTNPDTGDRFEDDDKLLEAVKDSIASGYYQKFEDEWKEFLLSFYEWKQRIENEK